VCVENVVRYDLVRESVNDGREGRAERRSLEHVQLEWSWSGNARAPPNADRFLLIWLLSLVPFHSAIAILRPKTIIRWHRPELGHIRGALSRGCVPWAIALVRDRRLGVRRVCRVLLDAADEIERGVQRLVVALAG
jgi:hypothetical protein